MLFFLVWNTVALNGKEETCVFSFIPKHLLLFTFERLTVRLHVLTHQIAEWPCLHSKAAPRSCGPCASGFSLACLPAVKSQSWPPLR